MATSYDFHPAALLEYNEAARFYLHAASPKIAQSFVAAVEFAVAALVTSPAQFRVVEEPEIRRYVLRRFPFAIYFQWDQANHRITIFAVMHHSRKPGYWQTRLAD